MKILKNLVFYAKNYWIKIYRLFLFFSVKSIQTEDESVIVSLTTHPARIKSSWISLISLFNQKATNYRIILVLSKEEFQNKKIPWTINFLEKKIKQNSSHPKIRDANEMLIEARGNSEIIDKAKSYVAKARRGQFAPGQIIKCVESAINLDVKGKLDFEPE